MIQSLGTTDALQERVVTVAYGVPLHLAPPQSADLTTLQPNIRFGNNAAPHSERCTGKSHNGSRKLLGLPFRHWLPLDRSTVTKDDVFAFLQDLFSTRSLAPSTIMNYRAALPLVLIGLAGRTCLILFNMVFGRLYVPF